MSDIDFLKEFFKDKYNSEYNIFVTEKVYNAIQNPTPNIIKCRFNWWDKLKWKLRLWRKIKGAKISDVRF